MQKVGWIKVYRKIQENWIWLSDEPYCMRSAWDYLLLNSYFEDTKITWKKQVLEIKRGQMITSLRELSQEWKWSTGKVTRFLNRLEKENMIIKEDVKNGTLLTIVNYEIYQDKENTNETVTEHQRNSDGTPTEHTRNADETRTEQRENTNGTGTEQERNTIKENKEDNNINNIQEEKKMEEDKKKEKEKHKYGEYNHVMLTDAERDRLFDEYGMEQALEAIKFLDEYIEMKGYKAKSHNMALRKWVFDAVKEEKERKKRNNSRYNSQTNDINRNQQTQLEWLLNGIKEEEQNEQNGN